MGVIQMGGDASRGSLYPRLQVFSIVVRFNGQITQFDSVWIVGVVVDAEGPERGVTVPRAGEVCADCMAGHAEFPSYLHGIQVMKSIRHRAPRPMSDGPKIHSGCPGNLISGFTANGGKHALSMGHDTDEILYLLTGYGPTCLNGFSMENPGNPSEHKTVAAIESR